MSGRFPLYTDADIRGPLINQLKKAGWDISRAMDEYPQRTKDLTHFHRAVELVVVHAHRGEIIRIISARRPTLSENDFAGQPWNCDELARAS